VSLFTSFVRRCFEVGEVNSEPVSTVTPALEKELLRLMAQPERSLFDGDGSPGFEEFEAKRIFSLQRGGEAVH